MSLAQLWRKLRHRKHFENELNDELAFHFESRRDALSAQGHSDADATRIARQELGMVELHKDAIRAAHGLAGFDQWTGELRRAVRSLARSPAFTISAMLILAAAIGVNLLLFSIYGTYALRAPDIVDRGELIDIDLRGAEGEQVSPLSLDELAAITPILERETSGQAISNMIRMMLGGDNPRTIYGTTVNGDYFRMIGVPAAIGRTLNREDDDRGGVPTVLLSNSGWRQLTGADPAIVGRSLQISGDDFIVVGVMPEGFVGLEAFPPQYWISNAHYNGWESRHSSDARVMGYEVSLVLADGTTPESLRQQLLPALQALPDRQGLYRSIAEVRVLPRRSLIAAEDADDLRVAAVPIFALVLLVLVVACANLANLMLARATSQGQELAIRASVGASRWRLMRQLLTECALLAVASAALGLVVCIVAADPVHRYALSLMVGLGMDPVAITVDPMLFVFASLLALVATASFGLAPALAVTGRNLAATARRDANLFAAGISPSKLRNGLMVLQVAASLVLLVAAALIVETARRAAQLDIGYSTDRLVDVRHPAPSAALRQRIEEIPGVVATTALARTPLNGATSRYGVIVDERSLPLAFNSVDERFFDTLGIKVRAGRNFRADEAANQSGVALISAATATMLWPQANPIGQRLHLVADDFDTNWKARDVEIIGVVDDVASGLLFTGRDKSAVYLPAALGTGVADLMLAIEPARHQDVVREVTRLCAALDAGKPCAPMRMTDVIALQHMVFSVASNIASVLGFVALLICAVGLYGVVRFTVVSRTREIGIRVALGATRAGVVRLVVHGAVRQVLLGLVIGLPLCLGASTLLSSTVGSAAAFAPSVYLVVPALLLFTALLATVLPARRATRIEATEALREA